MYFSMTRSIMPAIVAGLLLFAQAGSIDAGERAKKTVKGALLGAGVGALLGGSDGAKKGAVAGALIGNLKARK